ncbi:cysteine synthase [Spodoptera frugiperda]|uniref:Cysteine synthase n=1 Tax=Spodoptera frugiperda TaxID=7108 RepID=A0A9R0EPR0_SPOFR|nr:cysteine synthase [Spodoptera frugiperda]
MVRNNLVSFRRREGGEKPTPAGDGDSSAKPAVVSKAYNSVLELVGNTPLVKLNRLPTENGVHCDVYVKCEFMNPGGSIKDRIVLAMMNDARKEGVVTDQTEFVEATSGNTGIGLALNATLMGNKCTIVTTDKNSSEKVNTMRLLGADVIQTKNGAIETAIARRLKDENPDTVVILNQFDNEINPRSHYETTGEEILAALGKVDFLVLGAGSGGTLSGVGSRLKEHNPECKVVAAEPHGSIMINKDGNPHPFLVEGIGGSDAPIVLDTSLVDHIEVVTDKESFLMARELSKKEGLLCGGSSGAAVCAAFKAAKSLNIGPGKSVVVILPDGIRNYMTKFVSDQWMEAHRFLEPPEHTMKWWSKPISELNLTRQYPKLPSNSTCQQVLEAMNETNANIAVIVDDNGHYVGAVSKNNLRYRATNPTKLPGQVSEEYDFQDVVTDHLDKHVFTLADNVESENTTIGLLSRVLDITPYVIIVAKDSDNSAFCTPTDVVTGDDIIDHIFESYKNN